MIATWRRSRSNRTDDGGGRGRLSRCQRLLPRSLPEPTFRYIGSDCVGGPGVDLVLDGRTKLLDISTATLSLQILLVRLRGA
jgi:hypothetical protein